VPEPEQPRIAPQPEREKVDPEQIVLVAIPDVELAKQTASVLEERGLHTSIVHDGVEAMLEVQRQLPRAVLLSASLPKMYGFQVCEVMKRNQSLRSIPVVLAGSIYHTDRYRREPNELYGADAYLEDPDLPGGLIPILEGLGIPTTRVATPPPEPTPPQPSQTPAGLPEFAPEIPPAPVVAPEPPAVQEDDGLAEERAKAERLARIIVSDIVLYNDEKFADAVRRGAVLEKMSPDLEEGRDLFCSRIDERVCEEQDYLVEELLRVARVREAV
jgi:CheY-like chemotaxis protein